MNLLQLCQYWLHLNVMCMCFNTLYRKICEYICHITLSQPLQNEVQKFPTLKHIQPHLVQANANDHNFLKDHKCYNVAKFMKPLFKLALWKYFWQLFQISNIINDIWYFHTGATNTLRNHKDWLQKSKPQFRKS